MFVQMVLKGYLNDIIQQFANIFHIFPILLGKNQQSIPIMVYIIYIILMLIVVKILLILLCFLF